MTKDCTHKNYKLSPKFDGPRFEKHHVKFSALLDLPSKNLPIPKYLNFLYKLPLVNCPERAKEVSDTFMCMENLFPAPTGWGITQSVMDLDLKYKYPHKCVSEGKALVIYERPERNKKDFEDILKDMCEGYVIVSAYKDLSKNEQYYNSSIPFIKMREHYDNTCASRFYQSDDNKPSFCSAEYKFDLENQCKFYKLDCTEGTIYEAISDLSCSKSTRPEYSIHQSSYSLHREFSILSALSYKDEIEDLQTVPNGWSIFGKTENKDTSFFARAFINHSLKKIVIAYRGTDDLSTDWYGSNICFSTGCEPRQYKDALKFYNEKKESEYDFPIILIGHSLGGGLAQLVSIAQKVPAVVFDSPGVYNPAQKMFLLQDLHNLDHFITSYIFGLNLVNSCCDHIINPIKITENIIEDCNKYFFGNYTLSQHSIERAKDYFNANTGKPLFEERIDKSELGIFYARGVFQRDCANEINNGLDEIFSCANKLFKSRNLEKDKLIFDNGKVKIIQYLPELIETTECNISDMLNQSYAANINNGLLTNKKASMEQEVLYEFPQICSSEEKGEWTDKKLQDDSSIILHILTLNCKTDSDSDYIYYKKKILSDNDILNHYNIIDCKYNKSHHLCEEVKEEL